MIPLPFEQIVRHCLEKEPEKRFQSARDLAFALETLTETSGGRANLKGPPKLKAKLLPWAIAGMLLIATLWLAGRQVQQTVLSPIYHRLTFDEGTLYSARFTPDFRSVVYAAAWNGRPLQLFSTVGDSLLSQPLNLTDANLLAVSKSGELALVLRGAHMAHLQIEQGTLARAPLAGGSPRELLEDVRWADWGPDGELAVVHHAEGRDRIEYPLGHVVYQGNGWISHIRLSPQADKIAFINHPSMWDDRGLICLMDLAGHVQTLTPEWDSADGLAWNHDGKEIWFTAAEKGYTRALLAVDGSAKVRTILKIPAGLTLQDAAPDGRVLVSRDSERLAMATSASKGETENISWHDWDVAKDISSDGQSVLFEDASEAAPPVYSVAIRKIDGTPPIQLGDGSAGGLSPDGKWAISIIIGSPGRVTLYPIGPGQPRPYLSLAWSGSTTALLISSRMGNESPSMATSGAMRVRCFLVDVDSGKLTPVTPEGVTGGLVSPDGQSIIANNGLTPAVYSVGGGFGATHPRPRTGLCSAPVVGGCFRRLWISTRPGSYEGL